MPAHPPHPQPQAACIFASSQQCGEELILQSLIAAHKSSGGLTQARVKIAHLAVMFGYDDEIIHRNTGLTERKSGFNSPQQAKNKCEEN